ncbi:hypothetical protein CBR_g30910 [Chara braunii]|uniref:CCHC-type domain-containing protein n=1 Tax=Chara braunii TaxID=69332 RepID=A0A388LDR4_CHABU|nr:hypothetical protein CBR_g30910 [Chara braunii]|eukprot:GBG80446.1 hypothetical protein CBR_g30910 [Chara braunii]
MADQRDYDRRATRSSSEERGNSRSTDRGYDRGGDRYYRRPPPRCFSCNERGHYANQCPNRGRPGSRPSTSHDPQRVLSTSPKKDRSGEAGGSTSLHPELRRQIEELGRGLASVSEFVQTEMAKKAEEERVAKEAEAEAQRKAAEKTEREKKERKRLGKLCKDEERAVEIDKQVEIQVAIKTSEFFDRMEANLIPGMSLARKAKGKKQVVYVSEHETKSEEEGRESTTKDIRTKTGRLTINEKRKRGPEPKFDDSPPMLTPVKRTPRSTKTKAPGASVRVTRSKTKVKTKLSPYVDKCKRSPGQPGTVAKLRFRNQAMEELRGLDAQELQAICKAENIAYNGKVDAIFDIASHRTRKAFGEVEPVDLAEMFGQEDEDSTTVEDEAHKTEV